MLTKKEIRELKEIYLPGMEIELVHMEGEDMPSGTVGTVVKVDDIGQIHMKWQNGSSLALNTELDKFKVIKKTRKNIKL